MTLEHAAPPETESTQAKAPPRQELLRLQHAVARAVVNSLDESELVQLACELAVEIAGARFAWIVYGRGTPEARLRPAGFAGHEDGYIDEVESCGPAGEWQDEPAARAVVCSESTFEPELPRPAPPESSWRRAAEKRGLRAVLGLPLRLGGARGAFVLFWDHPVNLSPADLSVLVETAGDLGVGLGSKRASLERRKSDDALRRSEALLAAAQRMAHAGTFELSGFDERPFWTGEMYAITGREPTAGSPTPADFVAQYVVEEDRARVGERARRLLAVGGDDELEYRIRRADGEVRWIRSRMRAQLNERGEVDRAIGTLLDITERKRASEALRASEAKYRWLYENMRDAFGSVDMSGRLKEFNEGFCRLLGYSREELREMTFQQLTPEKWHAREQRVIEQQVLKRGYSDVYEKEYQRRDGSVVPVELRTTLVRDARGNPQEMWAIVRDIRERKRVEQALREREEMMRYIVKHDPNALAVLDRDLRYVAVSDRFLQDYGVRATEVLGKGHYQVFPEMPERWKEIHRRALAGEVIRDDDDSFVRPDGSTTYNRWECRPWYRASGEIAGIIMYTEVTTERKKMELELKEAARRKDAFLAVLGHELRNPLAPIRNADYVLRRSVSPSDERGQRAVAIIERQARHLSRIVDDLLDVSRIGRGKILLSLGSVDWAKLVQTTVEDFRSEVEKRGIALTVEVPAAPQWVRGDPARLAQIVSNLLGNASKFTDSGGRIEVRLGAARDGQITLTVRDTGVGMTPETLCRVFQPFVQAETDLSRSRGGLGLGLALVRGLVELHHGTVRAESRGPNQGTTVTLCLPAIAPPLDTPPRGNAAPVPAARAVRALIIEDDADAAESLRMLLEDWGAQVEVAFDGPSGIARVDESEPDLVLCDIGLPGDIDGYAVARAVRALPSGRRAARLVAMTGYGREEDRRRAMEAGFDAHMVKPVDPVAVERLLGEVAGAAPPAGKAGG